MTAHLDGGLYVVCARMGDPIARPARARLIWAAQTAQASADLGLPTLLTASARELPFKVEAPQSFAACRRIVSGLYNVAGDFGIRLLYPGDSKGSVGKWESEVEFPRHVLPYARIVHTRDPRVVSECVKRQVSVIYEDHNEDYHLDVNPDVVGLNSPYCRAIVAITSAVSRRLIRNGVVDEKIIVLDSGVNVRAFDRFPERAQSWRTFLLRGGHSSIAAYTGGMQEERGIGHTLNAAQELPDTMFVFAGGNARDIESWQPTVRRNGLKNVKFLGYLPQQEILELQQAADLQILSRNACGRAEITSPLKFFEYLASGTPVVSALLPVIDETEYGSAPVIWYDSGNPHTLVEAVRDSLSKYPYLSGGREEGPALARRYTWQERQAALLRFVGLESELSR